MNSILNAYKARFGSAVHQHPSSWNGPCPLCGGDSGKSDRFMIWECRSPEQMNRLGDLCRQHGITQAWACRRCGSGGDSISYYQKVEGMTFPEACEELGIELEKKGASVKKRLRRRAAPQEAAFMPRGFAPKAADMPKADEPEKWMTYAEKMLAEGQEAILTAAPALRWLEKRGIDMAAVREYRLGYRTPEGKAAGRYRYRSGLGLGKKEREGREVKKIFLPRGIMIPTFRADGRLVNLRTRKHNADVQAEKEKAGKAKEVQKYLSLEGGADPTFCLRSSRPEHLATYAVVEAELDAILIHHVTGGFVGAVAIRSNRNKPDAATHALLSKAARVLIALDYDAAGADGVVWWMNTYAAAVRWPVPEGKDPGDYFGMGGDVRQWLREALPLSSAARRTEAHGGSVADMASNAQKNAGFGGLEAVSGVKSYGGAGEVQCTQESRERKMTAHNISSGGNDAGQGAAVLTLHVQVAGRGAGKSAFSRQEQALIAAAVPKYLRPDDVPEDVRRLWLLWRGLPISFKKLGGGGFDWHIPSAWSKRHAREFERFWAAQEGKTEVWQWLSDHGDKEISWRNLFDVAGEK